MHPVCLKGNILLERDQKARIHTESQNHIFNRDISWFAMKKHNYAKQEASIAWVVTIFWSDLAFYQNKEKNLFISK